MDTKSALSFHVEIEEYIAQYSGSEPPVDTTFSPSTALLPPLEDLYKLPVSQGFF
jgi:hypothetical protein